MEGGRLELVSVSAVEARARSSISGAVLCTWNSGNEGGWASGEGDLAGRGGREASTNAGDLVLAAC